MEYKLDLKDRKILYELDKNCRQSFNQIARLVGLSKTAVINRISNMEKVGLIKGYSAVVNSGKLGFHNFRIYINLQNLDLDKENEIIEFLKEKKIVTWIATMEGLYNLGFRVFTKDIHEMNELWIELMKKYVNYFNQRLILLNIKTISFFRGHLIEDFNEVYDIVSSSDKEIRILDKLEHQIVEILSQNAKAQVIDIAKKTRTTPKTIISKIKRLEKDKVILFYRTVLDSEKINLLHFKLSLLTMNTTSEKLKEFYDYIKKSPNIIKREETLGGEDIELDLEVRSINELEEIINNIRKRFGKIIQDYNTHYIIKEHKALFFHP